MASNNLKGLLVMAYGTPESLDDVRPYLRHIRQGQEPSAETVEDLKERYRRIGGPSPLYRTTVDQMKALEERVNWSNGGYHAYLGMKHWHPFIPDTVREMAADGIRNAVAVALAPHYSTMSIVQYLHDVREGLDRLESPMEILCIKSYHDEPLFIDALEERLREAIAQVPDRDREDIPAIFTARSLPEKILQQDDPYREQLLETSRLVAERFDDLHWRFAFTSQGSTRGEWLGPTLAEALDAMAADGHSAVMCCSVDFVSEHLETLYDLDIEGKKDAEARGLAFYRAPALGTSATFIQALAEVVRKAEANELQDVVKLATEVSQAPTYPTYA
jgi:ferrochelatase